jgi:hypothetical protein
MSYGGKETRRRIPTDKFRIWRLCERLPRVVPTPNDFYLLPPEDQALLLAYECIREAEEAELASLGMPKSL